jgi:AcrR family transcriptional regulator
LGIVDVGQDNVDRFEKNPQQSVVKRQPIVTDRTVILFTSVHRRRVVTDGAFAMLHDTLSNIVSPEQLLPHRQIRVLQSAYTMLSEKGLNQLTLQHVADEVGVSKALLLYHFGSKENLILLTMQWALARVTSRIAAGIAMKPCARAQFLAVIDAIFTGAEPTRDFYLVYCDLVTSAARCERFGAVHDTFNTTINRVYTDIIRLGVEQGEFRVVDAEEASLVVHGIMDGLLTQWLHEKDWRGLYCSYREMCKRAILVYLSCSHTVECGKWSVV